MRWKLVLEYDGTGFEGWQVQPGARTVQGEVERAAGVLFQQPVRARASGRTDAGVHALGQVVVVDAAAPRTPDQVIRGLNALLPQDVAVVDARPVDPAFDPRRWARSKHYRYRWLDRGVRSPLRHRRVHAVRGLLDVEALAAAVAALVGEHDFSSFRARGCAAAHPVRTITRATVRRVADEVHLDVYGNGFLRHMIRIIAGTLEQVGLGRRDVGWVVEVLEARDRAAAGPTAPPGGLCLVGVTYADGPPPWIQGG